MAKEIEGMKYSREPGIGESIEVQCWDDLSGMTICKVSASGDVIAWDQIQTPCKGKHHRIAYAKRVRLARKTTQYWRGQGFTVEHFESGI